MSQLKISKHVAIVTIGSSFLSDHRSSPKLPTNILQRCRTSRIHFKSLAYKCSVRDAGQNVCRMSGSRAVQLLNSPDVQRMNSFGVLGTGLLTCCLSPKAAVDANNTSYKQVKLHCFQPTTKVEKVSSSIQLRAKRQSDV